MAIPGAIREVLQKTASSLGASLKAVGSLNGVQNAPMPERNTVVHCAREFLNAGFQVYAEPALPRTGRIDLLASNETLGVLVEVTAFGAKDMAKLLSDAKRMAGYKPQAERLRSGASETAFWDRTEHWGVVAVQCFAHESFIPAWRELVAPATDFANLLKPWFNVDPPSRQKAGQQVASGFRALSKFLQDKDSESGVEPVCDDVWKDLPRRKPSAGSPLHLLWCAFRLAR